MKLFCYGLNHEYADLAIRERLSFNKQELPDLLNSLLERDCLSEAVILSTCNRTELYLMGEADADVHLAVIEFLSESRQIDPAVLESTLYTYRDKAAIEHLFRVASGLDSMVVGEYEILGQVKDAMQIASKELSAKLFLSALFQRTLRCAKKVRDETRISEGSVSVASVSVDLARKIFGRLSRENILLMGRGEMGEQVLQRLLDAGARNIWITSRHYEHAEITAQKYGVAAIHFEEWRRCLATCDILIASTSSPITLISKEDIRDVMTLRKHKPLFIIDIAVPRDVDAEVREIDDVYLYNLDNLKSLCEENLKGRREEIRKCEEIVQQQLQGCENWFRNIELAPVIVAMQGHLEAIINPEKERLAEILSEDTYELVERRIELIKKKILHDPITNLKKLTTEGGGQHYLEALSVLFDLNLGGSDDADQGKNRDPHKPACDVSSAGGPETAKRNKS